MRFPSVVLLAEQAAKVLRRFPWTLAAGTIAAVAGIVATTKDADDVWLRLAFVAALGLPVGGASGCASAYRSHMAELEPRGRLVTISTV